jgi:hypothetical protein
MASFNEEIKEATKALQAFSGATRSATGGVNGTGASGAGREARPASATPSNLGSSVAGGVGTVASFLTPAANAFGIAGSSAGLSEAVSASALDAFRKTGIGGFALAAVGGAGALDSTARAGAATSSITEDLARIGVNVSDQQRQGLFRASLEQEKRVQREQAEVTKLSTSLDAIESARPDGAGKGFDAMIAILWGIQRAVEKISSFSGGGR